MRRIRCLCLCCKPSPQLRIKTTTDFLTRGSVSQQLRWAPLVPVAHGRVAPLCVGSPASLSLAVGRGRSTQPATAAHPPAGGPGPAAWCGLRVSERAREGGPTDRQSPVSAGLPVATVLRTVAGRAAKPRARVEGHRPRAWAWRGRSRGRFYKESEQTPCTGTVHIRSGSSLLGFLASGPFVVLERNSTERLFQWG